MDYQFWIEPVFPFAACLLFNYLALRFANGRLHWTTVVVIIAIADIFVTWFAWDYTGAAVYRWNCGKYIITPEEHLKCHNLGDGLGALMQLPLLIVIWLFNVIFAIPVARKKIRRSVQVPQTSVY